MTYDEWKLEISLKCEKWFGLSIDDLPDWNSRDAYDDGLSVDEAFDLMLEETGFVADDEWMRDEP